MLGPFGAVILLVVSAVFTVLWKREEAEYKRVYLVNPEFRYYVVTDEMEFETIKSKDILNEKTVNRLELLECAINVQNKCNESLNVLKANGKIGLFSTLYNSTVGQLEDVKEYPLRLVVRLTTKRGREIEKRTIALSVERLTELLGEEEC